MAFSLNDFFFVIDEKGKEITYIQFSPLGAGESETKKITLKNRSTFLLKDVRVDIQRPSDEFVKVTSKNYFAYIPQGTSIDVEVMWTCTKEQKEPLQTILLISGKFIKSAIPQ
jgi:uncharacterized membrane protein